MMEFMENLDALKEMKVELFGNMSCTMQALGYWDQENKPKKEFYKNDMFGLLPVSVEEEFKSQMSMKAEICFKFIETLPEPEMDLPPFKKMFGNGIMMHNCMHVSSSLFMLLSIQIECRLSSRKQWIIFAQKS